MAGGWFDGWHGGTRGFGSCANGVWRSRDEVVANGMKRAIEKTTSQIISLITGL